jgi:transposase
MGKPPMICSIMLAPEQSFWRTRPTMPTASGRLSARKGGGANIPPKANRRSKPYFSTWLYRQRNLVERFFSKLKHFRRVATRYDKLAENFLAMVQLASMWLWLRAYESTA